MGEVAFVVVALVLVATGVARLRASESTLQPVLGRSLGRRTHSALAALELACAALLISPLRIWVVVALAIGVVLSTVITVFSQRMASCGCFVSSNTLASAWREIGAKICVVAVCVLALVPASPFGAIACVILGVSFALLVPGTVMSAFVPDIDETDAFRRLVESPEFSAVSALVLNDRPEVRRSRVGRVDLSFDVWLEGRVQRIRARVTSRRIHFSS